MIHAFPHSHHKWCTLPLQTLVNNVKEFKNTSGWFLFWPVTRNTEQALLNVIKLKLQKQKTEAETLDVTGRQFITLCTINWGLTLLIPTRIDYSFTSKWLLLHIYCGTNSNKTEKSFLVFSDQTYVQHDSGFNQCLNQIESSCSSYYLFPWAWRGEPGFCKSRRMKKASAPSAVEAATKSIKPWCRALSQSPRHFFLLW